MSDMVRVYHMREEQVKGSFYVTMDTTGSNHHLWTLPCKTPEVMQSHQNPNQQHQQILIICDKNVCKKTFYRGRYD